MGSDNILPKIAETALRRNIKRYVLRHSPDNIQFLTKKTLNDAVIFAQGYYSCIKTFGEEPMSEFEIGAFVTQETIHYVQKRITDGNRDKRLSKD